jgi:hypothetical protein
MYTRVNNTMRLDRMPGSSVDDVLLDASLKALTTDQFSADVMAPAVVCEPLCANQALRTMLLVIMPMLDDVDITPVQRGDQSRGVVIPRLGGLGGTAGGHGRGGGPPAGRGGVPAGGGPASSHSGTPTGSGGGGPIGGSSPAPAPGKGKHVRVVLDADEVSSDEDEPMQKWLRQLSSSGSAVLNEAATMMATTDKETMDKRATEERAAEEWATAKAAAAEEVAGKTTDEATRAVGGSPAPDQAPSVAEAKRAVAPGGSTPLAKRPQRGV